MIVPRAALVEWMGRLRDHGKRTLLVSDIYLPAAAPEAPSRGQGPYRSGRGRRVLGGHVPGQGVRDRVHPRAGAVPPRPESFGCTSVTTQSRTASAPPSTACTPWCCTTPASGTAKALRAVSTVPPPAGISGGGATCSSSCCRLEAENAECDPLYVEGYNFFGVLLANFLHRVATECRRLDVRRIYFCSREGWTFQRIWDALTPFLFPDGDAPDSRYLYVSRMALAPTACANDGLALTRHHGGDAARRQPRPPRHLSGVLTRPRAPAPGDEPVGAEGGRPHRAVDSGDHVGAATPIRHPA